MGFRSFYLSIQTFYTLLEKYLNDYSRRKNFCNSIEVQGLGSTPQVKIIDNGIFSMNFSNSAEETTEIREQ